MTRVERLARLLGLARTGVNLNWLLTGEGERQARSGVVE